MGTVSGTGWRGGLRSENRVNESWDRWQATYR